MSRIVAPDFQENVSNIRNTTLDLLFTDVELAFTFLETAEASACAETQKRNVANALEAHRTVSAKLRTLAMSDAVRTELKSRLQDLAQALAKRGISV
jgi:hypothetical protein